MSRLVISLALNDWQAEALEPLFARIARDNQAGRPPGGIVAQVFPDGMRVKYFPAAVIVKMAKARGRKNPETLRRAGAFERAFRAKNGKGATR